MAVERRISARLRAEPATGIVEPLGEGAHLPVLDGVRAVAILLVMMAHFTMVRPRGVVHAEVLRVMSLGRCGVDLFFVLSGFLITGVLLDTRGSQRYFRNFYARRGLRILPLYYGVLAAVFVLGPRVAPDAYDHLGPLLGHQVWIWLHGTNLIVAQRGFAAVQYDWLNLGHFWSLAVEEHFYLVWPAVVARFESRRLLQICTTLVALPLALRMVTDANTRHVFTPCRMDDLAIGCWIAVASREPGGLAALVPAARRIAWLTGAILLIILLGGQNIDWTDARMGTAGLSVLGMFFGASLVLVVHAAPGTIASRILGGRALAHVGRYSYAVYVFHLLLLPLTNKLFPEPFWSAWTGSPVLGTLVVLACSMLLNLVLGWASWNLYERHFLALKRFF